MSQITKENIMSGIRLNRDILRRYQVRSVALFGSYVRDEQTEDSDIDLLVEFENNTYSNFINLTYDLEDIFHKVVTVVSEADLSPYIKPYVLKEAHKIEG